MIRLFLTSSNGMETKPCMSRCLRYVGSRHHSHDSLMAEVGLKEVGGSKDHVEASWKAAM